MSGGVRTEATEAGLRAAGFVDLVLDELDEAAVSETHVDVVAREASS